MKQWQLQLRKLGWLERAWLLAPVAVWFSFQPLFRFGQDSSTYYELSVTVVYLVVLALTGLPAIWRAKHTLLKQVSVWAAVAFVGFGLLSLFWTSNFTRGFLTEGIAGLLLLVFLAAVAEQEKLRKLLPLLSRIFVFSAVVMSVLAVVQVIAGIWLPRNETLLCAGCVADQFGFARPNLFAIEPQFLGNLLLAPLLIVTQRLLKGERGWKLVASTGIVSVGLFLTLSRGAMLAFAVGMLVLFLFSRSSRAVLKVSGLVIAAFVVTIFVQGMSAALNPRVDVTFYGAVKSSINQLSLGVIKLPEEQKVVQKNSETTPVFSGYVPESTDTRTSLSGLALGTWRVAPARIIFGVGAGSSGVTMHQTYPDAIDTREIVQNQYLEVLLEYGLVGMSLFAVLVFGTLRQLRRRGLMFAVVVAYAVQWWFFSGYPNALHVYLALILFVAVSLSSERHVEVGQKRQSSK